MDMFLSQDQVVNLLSLAANVAHLWQDQNILASKSQIHHVHRKTQLSSSNRKVLIAVKPDWSAYTRNYKRTITGMLSIT